MVKPLSGALLAEKMANGTLTNEEQNAINAQRKKSKEAASLFTKQKEKNLQQGKEFARGYAMQSKQKKQDVYKQDFLNMMFNNKNLLNL